MNDRVHASVGVVVVGKDPCTTLVCAHSMPVLSLDTPSVSTAAASVLDASTGGSEELAVSDTVIYISSECVCGHVEFQLTKESE